MTALSCGIPSIWVIFALLASAFFPPLAGKEPVINQRMGYNSPKGFKEQDELREDEQK